MIRLIFLAAAVLLLWPPVVAAQPVDPADYLPLAAGNEWEYEHAMYRPQTIDRPRDESRTLYERYRILSADVDADTSWYTIEFVEWGGRDVILRQDSVRVRYDTATSSVVGGEAFTVLAWARCLDLPPGTHDDKPDCSPFVGFDELYDENLFGPGPVTAKSFASYVWSFSAVAGIGLVKGGGGCEPCGPFTDRDDWSLRFARVDGADYGARIVRREGGPVVSREPVLVAYPNPTRGFIHLAGAVGDRVAVFDILGRRVLEVRQVQADAAIDLAHLPPGLYVVVSDGRTATVVLDRRGSAAR